MVCASANPQILVSGINGLGLTLGGLPLATHQVISHAPTVLSAPIAYSAPAVIAPAVTKTQVSYILKDILYVQLFL